MHSVEIQRPAAEAFACVADFANIPARQGAKPSREWTSPTKLVKGSTYKQVLAFTGKRVETHFVVTEYVEGQRVSVESRRKSNDGGEEGRGLWTAQPGDWGRGEGVIGSCGGFPCRRCQLERMSR